MPVSEPPCNPHKTPDGPPLARPGSEKHKGIKLIRKGLDVFGLLALLAAAVLLFTAAIADGKFGGGGEMIRISIAALNVSVLALASARLLEMIRKARDGGDLEGKRFKPKRSDDLSMRTAPHPEAPNADTAAADARSARERKSNGDGGEILYASAWRKRTQDAAHADEPPSTAATAALNGTPRLQDTDAADEIKPKSIH